MECFDILVIPTTTKREKNFAKAYSAATANLTISKSMSDNTLNNSSESSLQLSLKKTVVSQKIFTTYENQRWRLGRGWCTNFYGDERPPWSDEQGQVAQPQDGFKLPGPNWHWESDWTFVITPQTDALGWDNGKTFKGLEKSESYRGLVHVVRRRKWMRRCVEIQEQGGS